MTNISKNVAKDVSKNTQGKNERESASKNAQAQKERELTSAPSQKGRQLTSDSDQSQNERELEQRALAVKTLQKGRFYALLSHYKAVYITKAWLMALIAFLCLGILASIVD